MEKKAKKNKIEQAAYKIEGRQSTIFRVVKNKDNPYVMIDRRPITNPALSFKAKGILAYLLSRPDGWEVNVPDLVNHSTDGPAAIRSGLKELRNAHHVAYVPTREEGRITKWVVEVYEIPYDLPMEEKTVDEANAEAALDDDFQQVENQQVEILQVENRGQLNNELKKGKKSSININTAASVSAFNSNATLTKANTILCNASGYAYLPGGLVEKQDTVYQLLQTYPEQEVIDALETACAEWKKNKRKDNNRNYSALNPAWVDWAVAHLAGETPWLSMPKKLTTEERIRMEAEANGYAVP